MVLFPDFWISGRFGNHAFGLLPIDEHERETERLQPQVRHPVNADEGLSPTRAGVFRFRGVPIRPANFGVQFFACPTTPLPLAPQYGGDVGRAFHDHGPAHGRDVRSDPTDV